TVEHPKYAGRRIFSAGINLTHLYQGKIAFLFYFQHAMGYENKMLRGIARNGASPDDLVGSTIEKPWIAVVESFAIGGGCQHLLVMDYVLATDDAYLTLPARKEGIIPAMANLRLPRFVGDRLARQSIMYGRRINCNSPEGRLICDEVVPADQMDGALIQVVDNLTNSGIVSAVGNRRQFRIGQELWICVDSTLPFLRRSKRSVTSAAASFQTLNAFGVRNLEPPNTKNELDLSGHLHCGVKNRVG